MSNRNRFRLEILRHYWIDAPEEDVCSHGEILFQVGEEIILDGEDGEWNINESVLFLLRTVKYDYLSEDDPRYLQNLFSAEEGGLIFHCGCFIMFCPMRVGWKVEHVGDRLRLCDFKKYPSTNESEVIEYPNLHLELSIHEYAKRIATFALEAKKLFQGVTKNVQNSELYAGQYADFWQEYDELLSYAETKIDQ